MTTYTPGALWQKKPVAVQARLITEAELVTTAHGRVRAEAGDWILRDPKTGDTWPIKPDIFAATYEPAENGAASPGLLEALKELLEASDLDPDRPMTADETHRIAVAQGKAQKAIAQAQAESVRLPGGKE